MDAFFLRVLCSTRPRTLPLLASCLKSARSDQQWGVLLPSGMVRSSLELRWERSSIGWKRKRSHF